MKSIIKKTSLNLTKESVSQLNELMDATRENQGQVITRAINLYYLFRIKGENIHSLGVSALEFVTELAEFEK